MLFLKFLQNSQENICTGVSFYKAAGLQACNFIKNRDSNSGVLLWILQNS